MTSFDALLRELDGHQVACILVGGAAAIAHGSSRLTQNLDLVYERTQKTSIGLSKPWPLLDLTLKHGLNFTLITTLGAIDLLGEIPGGGSYADLVAAAVRLRVFGRDCLCLSLQQLIRAKRASGRPKDWEALAELEAIAEESGATGNGVTGS